VAEERERRRKGELAKRSGLKVGGESERKCRTAGGIKGKGKGGERRTILSGAGEKLPARKEEKERREKGQWERTRKSVRGGERARGRESIL
jgi:hypothetical protein